MTDRPSRRRWLALFVSLNLVLWIAAAVAIGVIASDRVDLGGETLMRTWHATAKVALRQAAARLPGVLTTPTASPAPGIGQPQPAGGATAEPTAAARSKALNPGASISETQPTRTPRPPSATAAAAPAETAVIAPLLLSDPGISNLMSLDAEMDRSAPGRAVQIRYQEAALNQEVQILLQDYPDLPYRDVSVDLQRDAIVVTGDITVLGFRTGVKMIGKVIAVDCRPKLEVQAISILGILTPGFVKDQVLRTLLEVAAWYPPDYPLCLEQIVLEEDRATVYGHCR